MLDLLHAEEGSKFLKFCEFKALVEKELGKQVKDFKRDNGGEYISNDFKNFCNKKIGRAHV